MLFKSKVVRIILDSSPNDVFVPQEFSSFHALGKKIVISIHCLSLLLLNLKYM